MKREEEIEQASVAYTLSKKPNAIGGDAFADIVYQFNRNSAFIAGAEWADEHPVIKVGGAAKNYQRGYKEAVTRACEWLRTEARYYWGTEDDIYEMIEDFQQTMEE